MLGLAAFNCRSAVLIRFAQSCRFLVKDGSKTYSTLKSAKGADHEDISKIRNIGVIAHVDAGKTTTTERMLYYSGFTKAVGNVDDGNTVMDYMEQERQRGITITSAAITFPWKTHKFNLIDTPGHIDFTIEVERSLRVLDGAVAIIDASAGVEAQTIGVWKQSNKHKIPRIAYINKMDKSGANFEMSLNSIEKKLNTVTLPLQIPIGREKSFVGVIDLVNMNKLLWDSDKSQADFGKTFQIQPLEKSDKHYETAFKYRVKLVEKLAQINERFAEILLDKYQLVYEDMNDNILLDTHLRQANLTCKATPILCGSSFRNIGVQPLMDAVVKYLPSPDELEKNNLIRKHFEKGLNFTCFKIVHDHTKSRKKLDMSTSTATLSASMSASSRLEKRHDENMLAYVRVYNGELSAGEKLYNMNKSCKEECDKIYIPFANQIKQVSSIGRGNIGVISGLSKTTTGDFLVTNKQSIEGLRRSSNPDKVKLAELMTMGVNNTPPVYFCSIESSSEQEERLLNYALECLEREDPSIRVIFNDEDNMGQTIIQGMGQLHLDIIKDRLIKEYKLNVYFGKLNIAYKELPTLSATERFVYEKKSNVDSTGQATSNRVEIELSLSPLENYQFDSVDLSDYQEPEDGSSGLTKDQLSAVNHGIRSALNKGTILRYPVINSNVKLNFLSVGVNTPKAYISTATYMCMNRILKQAECVLIQPLMNVEVTTTKEYSPGVYRDLLKRKAIHPKVNDVLEETNAVCVSGKVPLANLSTFSTDIRKITSGNASFSIEFESYEQLSQAEYQELLKSKQL